LINARSYLTLNYSDVFFRRDFPEPIEDFEDAVVGDLLEAIRGEGGVEIIASNEDSISVRVGEVAGIDLIALSGRDETVGVRRSSNLPRISILTFLEEGEHGRHGARLMPSSPRGTNRARGEEGGLCVRTNITCPRRVCEMTIDFEDFKDLWFLSRDSRNWDRDLDFSDVIGLSLFHVDGKYLGVEILWGCHLLIDDCVEIFEFDWDVVALLALAPDGD